MFDRSFYSVSNHIINSHNFLNFTKNQNSFVLFCFITIGFFFVVIPTHQYSLIDVLLLKLFTVPIK